MKRVDDRDVESSVFAVGPATHVYIGRTGFCARQEMWDFPGRGAVGCCSHLVCSVAKFIMACNSFASHGARDGVIAHDVIGSTAGDTISRGIKKRKTKAVKRRDSELLLLEM